MQDGEPPSEQDSGTAALSRRSFLVGGTALGAAVSLAGCTFATKNGNVRADPWLQNDSEESLIPQSTDVTRHWLGPDLWGNRLQDWRFTQGRIECLRGGAGYELRTVAALTREIVVGNEPAHFRVQAGVAAGADKPGFCGVLLGTGNGELDYRARALAQRSSGTGGGLLCTYETDGHVRFREHTDRENPVAYQELPSDDLSTTTTAEQSTTPEEIRLAVDILPQNSDQFTVQVKAFEADTGNLLAGTVRTDVPEQELVGGVALASSPLPGEDGPRWWFERFTATGGKIATNPERTFGPIAGTLYSIDDSVLNLSAHFLPVGDADPDTVRLRYRPTNGGGAWRTTRTTLGPGYTAIFSLDNWNATQAWEYQVLYTDVTGQQWQYNGHIDANPKDTDELAIGLLSCTEATVRQLDGKKPASKYAEAIPGRYTPTNIYFPYETLCRNLQAHDPDLLVCVGDQLYEVKPTTIDDQDDPGLDYLYKWYLWLWSFRDLTRDTPTIVLVDDHDVYQPMLWGSGGDQTSRKKLLEGGYVGTAEFINRVQRIQCGHNPDPHNSRSAQRGISTYYGRFTYGGASFAFLEDRKFKTAPHEVEERRAREAELLGERQEQFLAEWAADDDADAAVKVCLTQTCFASPLTLPGGDPATIENAPGVAMEANGFPKGGRDRAIKHLTDAGALVLAGDLHLPMLLRHGLETHTDGVVQFVGPGGAALWPRWFDPANELPNGRGYPNTGDFTDGFGNKLRMLAVANPDISYKRFEETFTSEFLHDREKRPDGYGIVRVDYEDEAFIIECWPWDVDPTADDATQFPGWPYRLPFDETTRGE